MAGDPQQRRADAVAHDQPGRPDDGGGRERELQRALPGVRRPRQQPRRVHAQHDRVARHGVHVAPVGAGDHPRAPPGAPAPSRIWLPPFEEPIALDAPPLISAEINSIGMAIDQGLDERDLPGALHGGPPYDAWYPGYIDYMSVFQNIASFWTETAPSPIVPRQTSVTDEQTRPQTLYPNPWPGGSWGLADAMKYMETASMSMLDYAARYKDTRPLRPLRGRPRSDRRRPRRRRPTRTSCRRRSAIRSRPSRCCGGSRSAACACRRRRRRLTIDSQTFPAGTWVVPTDQEFAALAREVLDVQKYPNHPGARRRARSAVRRGRLDPAARDGRAHVYATAPLADDVRSHVKLLGPMPDAGRSRRSRTRRARPTPRRSTACRELGSTPIRRRPAIVPPAGQGQRIADRRSRSIRPRTTRSARSTARGRPAATCASSAATSTTGARYVITGLSTSAQDQMVSSLALTAERRRPPPARRWRSRASACTTRRRAWTTAGRAGCSSSTASTTRPSRPRISRAPHRSRIASTCSSSPTSAASERVVGASGAVVTRAFDGSGRAAGAGGGRAAGAGGGGRPAGAGQGGGAGRGRSGGARGRHRRGARRVRARGRHARVPQSQHGVGHRSLHLPVTNTLSGVNRRDFFSGISLLNVETTPTERVMAGMPDEAAVFVDGSPVFETGEGFTGAVLARYPATGSPLASGYLLGEKYLQGKAAALDVTLGDGPRRPARLPPAMARPAVRHVPRAVQRRAGREVGGVTTSRD